MGTVHADKLGPIGSIVVALCCLGAVVAAVLTLEGLFFSPLIVAAGLILLL